MALAFGDTTINKLYFGDNEVKKMYFGDDLAYEATTTITIPTQTFSLGTASTFNERNTEWEFEPNLKINTNLTSKSDNSSYLARVSLAWGGWIEIDIADSSTGNDNTDGKELRGKWETNPTNAVVLTTSQRSVTIPGPNTTGARVRDSSEPYRWRFTNTVREDIRTFISWYAVNSPTIRATAQLTLTSLADN